MLDNYMRQHKHSGAWMSDYRAQSRSGSADGSSVIPIICNNNNFAKGSEVCTAIAVIQCNTYHISYFCVSTVILFTNLKLIYPAMFPPLSLSCSFSLSLPPLSPSPSSYLRMPLLSSASMMRGPCSTNSGKIRNQSYLLLSSCRHFLLSSLPRNFIKLNI